MHATRIVIIALWVLWAVYWLSTATRAKPSRGSFSARARAEISIRIVTAAIAIGCVELASRAGLRADSLNIHSLPLWVLGILFTIAGLGVAVWARVHLGANWGMPMTQRADPELVTSGPYRLVRHPIYSGLLLAILGAGAAINLIGLIVAAYACLFFLWSARTEERNMTAAFPEDYPAYRAHSKAIIPFIL